MQPPSWLLSRRSTIAVWAGDREGGAGIDGSSATRAPPGHLYSIVSDHRHLRRERPVEVVHPLRPQLRDGG